MNVAQGLADAGQKISWKQLWQDLTEACRAAGGTLVILAHDRWKFVKILKKWKEAHYASWQDGDRWHHQVVVTDGDERFTFDLLVAEENL
jgi:hypothetical protein